MNNYFYRVEPGINLYITFFDDKYAIITRKIKKIKNIH